MDEINEVEFCEYPNTLLYETCLPDDLTPEEERALKYKKTLESIYTNNMSQVSSFYIYTNTPPHGYGTQAPKVAETVYRAYSFNKKKENKTIKIDKYQIERMHWEKSDGKFKGLGIHGNFIPSEMNAMCKQFLKDYHLDIDGSVEKIMKKLMNTNSDILTAGRQTFCPFTNQSVTAAVAYRRAYDFLQDNTGHVGMSCMEWIHAIMKCLEKETLTYTKLKEETVDRLVYNKETRQRTLEKKTIRKMVRSKTESLEDSRDLMIKMSRRFASYLKHKERGKKDRRAICSANMFLRIFLRVIEDFHLLLAKSVKGSTISIGGEEKKLKITNNLSLNTLNEAVAPFTMQGTEDATKWNECLAPSSFALMHLVFFDNEVRLSMGLPPSSQWGQLFSKIAVAGNYLMSLKQIQLGSGVQVQNDNFYSRITWDPKNKDKMSTTTLQWYEEIEDKLSEDFQFLEASPGMLMGMLNAASTTLGLLAVNHRMNREKMKVVTLRSSDDSMSLYLADDRESLINCVNMNKQNLELIGINLSPDKTFFFPEGTGEYTSWYMDGKFVSQYGVETASLRPQGKNPNDDFYAVAKGTSTALTTLVINPLGASVRLRLGIMGVKRVWKTKKPTGREGVSNMVLSICDGGKSLWNCMNSHLDDTALRERHQETVEDHSYLLRLRNPENPFNEQEIEEVMFSKEAGTMVLDKIENPKNIYSYVKRSNRTFRGESKKTQEEQEKAHAGAIKIVKNIDLPTLIEYPKTATIISDNLIAILRMQRENLLLDEDEHALYMKAIERLSGVPESFDFDDKEDSDSD